MRLGISGLLFAIVLSAPLFSQNAADHPARPIEIVDGHEAAAQEVLVKFNGPAPVAELKPPLDIAHAGNLVNGWWRIRSRSVAAGTLVAILSSRRDVVRAEPNYIVRGAATPNDPSFRNQWFLRNAELAGADIHATAAWNSTTGSPSNVIGLIDSGIQYTHPDLAANIWSAPSSYTISFGGLTITCPAGSHGYDAIANTCDPMDQNGHGTEMGGVLGAVGNNGVGVSGVNWRTSIMGLRFLDADAVGAVSDAVTAVEFAVHVKQAFASSGAANLRVLSNSWASDSYSQALHDAIADAGTADMLFVAAAGNDSTNNDVTPRYPANYDVPNVVAVAATDKNDRLDTSYSNDGATTVDLGAPGTSIYTTQPGTYAYVSGTSPATAVTSGAAALVLARCALTTAQLKQTILSTVDPLPSLSGVTVTGGRVNVERALDVCSGTNAAPTVEMTSPDDQTHVREPGTVTLAATAHDIDGTVTKVSFYAGARLLATDTTSPYAFTWSGIPAGTYELSAVATDNLGATTRSSTLQRLFVDPPPANVPAPWATRDIGSTGVAGTAFANSDGSFTVEGAGAGIGGTADAFRFMYQSLAGDGEIVARVRSIGKVQPSTQAGIMIRNGFNTPAVNASMVLTASSASAFQWRPTDPGNTTAVAGPAAAVPRWVKLTRTGQTLAGYISADGTTWTPVGQTTLSGSYATLLFGLVVSSRDTTRDATAVFDNVSVSGFPPPPLPAGWSHRDIGSVGVAGSAAYSNGTFTIAGAGADIWGTADAFQFAYRSLTGDGRIVARIATVQDVNAWTKSGVMIRATLDPGSAHASMFVTPGKGLAFQRRTAAGGISVSTTVAGTAPRWVRLVRAAGVITASVSSDGSTWTTVGQQTMSLPATVYVGLAVSSHSTTQLATSTIDSVSVSAPSSLPSGWKTSDVGAVGVAGSATASGGTFTVKGAGADIWGTADAFRYAYYPLPGDGSIVARVATVEYVEAWTKAGVMIRQSLDPGSAHASMFVTPGKGLAFQRRKTTGGTMLSTSTAGAAPMWVKVTRSGQTLTAFASSDGTTWKQVGQDTAALSGAVWAGLAVSSHDSTRRATATFDHVAVTSALPAGWTAVDVGAVGVAGTAAYASGTFTVSGSGADIWGTADAFHFVYRALNGDGQLTARVASVQSVSSWSKAGVMIRDTLGASSAYALMLVSASKGASLQYRTSAGAAAAGISGSASTAPRWVRIARSGSVISGYESGDGATFAPVGSVTIPMGTSVAIGLAVTSHDNTRLGSAKFDHVTP